MKEEKLKKFDLVKMGERIRELRNERELGQNRLAEILDVSNASISYWENAKQEPSASAIFKMADFFGVTADYLLGLQDW